MGLFMQILTKLVGDLLYRDCSRQVMVADTGPEEQMMNAQHSKAMACIKGLELAASLGIQRIILEADATG
jgi:hypothetical protein